MVDSSKLMVHVVLQGSQNPLRCQLSISTPSPGVSEDPTQEATKQDPEVLL